jgi:hypothetical protein
LKEVRLTVRAALEQMATLVAEHLEDGLYIYSVAVDEQVFYSEFEERLGALDSERPVVLTFYTENELLAAMLVETGHLLDDWLRTLPEIADAFYAGQGSLDRLAQLAEVLSWLQMVSVQLVKREYADLTGWPERLGAAAGELLQVAESGQATAQGDFLLYELQGALEGLRERLARVEIKDGEQK